MQSCDTDKDGLVKKDEAITCAEKHKAPKEIIDFIKEYWPTTGLDKEGIKEIIKKIEEHGKPPSPE